MKMSLARALKEKNRLIGEMNRLWTLVIQNNQVVVQIPLKKDETFVAPDDSVILAKMTVDVKDLYKQYIAAKERLLKVKAAITRANAGAAETLVKLAEAKSALARINQISVGQANDRPYSEYVQCVRFALDNKWHLDEVKRLTDEVNALQDEIDEYNAKTSIELD